MESKSLAGLSQSILLLLVFLLALVFVAGVAVWLLSSSEEGAELLEDSSDASAPVTSRETEKARADTGDEEDVLERVILETGQAGYALSGRLSMGGTLLSHVTVEAFEDLPRRISPSLAGRIQRLPFLYGAAGKDSQSLVPEPEISDDEPVGACTTDEEGVFSFTLMPAESITFQTNHDFYFLPGDQAGPYYWDQDAEPPRILSFPERLEAELGAMIQGKVLDREGFPLEGVLVEVLHDDPVSQALNLFAGGRQRRQLPPKLAITDAAGAFSLRAVPPGSELRLAAHADDFVPFNSDPFDAAPGEVVQIDLNLDEGAEVRVLVRGPDLAPLEGVEVFLKIEADRAQSEDRRMRFMTMFRGSDYWIAGTGKTDEEGECIFQNLADGEYEISASHPGMMEADPGEKIRIKEKDRTHSITLDLILGASLAGRIL
ncbi:MAG: hypothetical protein ACYTG7_23775, partial [Planctomycetota bacterium]